MFLWVESSIRILANFRQNHLFSVWGTTEWHGRFATRFAIDTPIFIARQTDSPEALEFPIRANHATKPVTKGDKNTVFQNNHFDNPGFPRILLFLLAFLELFFNQAKRVRASADLVLTKDPNWPYQGLFRQCGNVGRQRSCNQLAGGVLSKAKLVAKKKCQILSNKTLQNVLRDFLGNFQRSSKELSHGFGV